MAAALSDYGSVLKEKNIEYRSALSKIAETVDVLLFGDGPASQEDDAKADEMKAAANQMAEGVKFAKESTESFVGVLEDLPDVERSFMRAREFAARELRALISNLDQTISIAERIQRFEAKQP